MGSVAMTELPAGFALEQEGAPSQGAPLPPGFVLEGAPPPERGRQGFEIIDDVMRSLAGGASFGLADEFAAYMSTLTGRGGLTEGGTYEQELAAQRERQEAIPAGIAIPGEIVGGVASTIAAVPAAAAAVPARVAQAAKQFPGWAKAAGLGALFGGAYGFGTSEGGLEERGKGTAYGAGLGGVTGGVGYPLMRGAQIGLGKVGTAIKSRVAPESTARAK